MKLIRYENANRAIGFAIQSGSTYLVALGNWNTGFRATQEIADVQRILAPIVPSQLLGIGLNYRDHAIETNAKIPEFPVIFFKNISSVQDPDGPIRFPAHQPTTKMDYEGELAVIIGRPCLNATVETALDFVFGYTIAHDVSARDWQLERTGKQWCYAKGFDTFCPLGPCVITADELSDPQSLPLQTRVNGELLQNSNTSDMIFTVAELIAFASADTTLPSGTVILTGTPAGVGLGKNPPTWLQPGDLVEITIPQIGTLCNPVIGPNSPV